MFSKTCEYGIKAAVYIANCSERNEAISLKEIARAINSPEAFTAKILQILVKHDIIESRKGPKGGFFIQDNDIGNILLIHIVQAIDGDDLFNGCGLGFEQCDENKPCPMHDSFKFIRNDIRKMLETNSLRDLTKGLDSGLTFLK